MSSRLLTRLTVLVAVVVAALAAVASAQIAAPRHADAATAQNQNRAVVMIDDGTNQSATCIYFDGEISGVEALQRSGAEVTLAGFGGLGQAICGIGGVGCPPTACLTCQGADHWNYLRAEAAHSGVSVSPVGGSASKVRHDDVEAWIWGGQVSVPAKPSVDQVCGPEADPSPVPPPSTSGPTSSASGASQKSQIAPLAGSSQPSPAAANNAQSGTPVPSQQAEVAGESQEPGGDADPDSSDTTDGDADDSDITNETGPPSRDGSDRSSQDETTNGGFEGTSEAAVGVSRPDAGDGRSAGSIVGIAVGTIVIVAVAGWAVWVRRNRRVVEQG